MSLAPIRSACALVYGARNCAVANVPNSSIAQNAITTGLAVFTQILLTFARCSTTQSPGTGGLPGALGRRLLILMQSAPHRVFVSKNPRCELKLRDCRLFTLLCRSRFAPAALMGRERTENKTSSPASKLASDWLAAWNSVRLTTTFALSSLY